MALLSFELRVSASGISTNFGHVNVRPGTGEHRSMCPRDFGHESLEGRTFARCVSHFAL
jgi:hypothetical protein